MSIIEVRNLCKDYKYSVKDEKRGFIYNLFNSKEKKVHAVKNISFDVEEGETIAFIGPNGAGKSTTIKMLTGILYPTSGDIKICGETPIKDRNSLAYKIGTVFGQRSQLLPNLPLTDSMEMFGAMYDMSKEEIDQRIYKFPTSQVKDQGKKSSYYDIISSLAFEECNNALVRITQRVDLNKINKLIDSIEDISDLRREFYNTILKQRFEKILLESYNKLKLT